MKLGNINKRTLICVVSGILGVVCVLLYTHSVRSSADAQRREALSRYGGEQVEVCVASRDITAGETIDSSSYTVKMWIADLLPQDAIRNANDILGKQVTSTILSGEVISNKRFTDTNINIEVPAGYTAVSVPAKDVNAIGGALSAGMKINVYSTGNTSTVLIAQNVLVLATSATVHESSNSSTSVSWVTLALEPKIVDQIVGAAQNSTMYFTLPSQDTNSEESKKSNSGAGESQANTSDNKTLENSNFGADGQGNVGKVTTQNQ